MKPHMVGRGVSRLVHWYLGSRYVGVPREEIATIYKDTRNRTPVIFVLSPGADPTAQIMSLAAELIGEQEKLHIVSLGQGQGTKALRLINDTSQFGHWTLLQNCHLARSWLPSLETIVVALCEDFA